MIRRVSSPARTASMSRATAALPGHRNRQWARIADGDRAVAATTNPSARAAATRSSTSARAEAICSAPSRAATAAVIRHRVASRAARGNRPAPMAGRLCGGPGPEVMAAIDAMHDGVDACPQVDRRRVPGVGRQASESGRHARPRDGRPGHGRWKRSALRRSARSNASADMCAATAHPRMFAMTSVSLAAIRSGAATLPTAEPRSSSVGIVGQRISAIASAASVTRSATPATRSDRLRVSPHPHAGRSPGRGAEVIHRRRPSVTPTRHK